jgi:16S rRNA (adenine1518-N6/adenine1519-N6)-dimethyltransferase
MKQRDSFSPKKSLGQNFLVNANVAQRIIASCHLKPTEVVLEIGPGKGALTRELSRRCKTIIAVEKDRALAEQLTEEFKGSNVHMINNDILQYPFNKLPDKTKIIGNLPYNIATPIIEKIITHRTKFQEAYITVQLEYGQRIVAKPSTKSYGSFSCFVQYYMNPEILFKIKNSAFQPIPKVRSCFLRLNILDKPNQIADNDDLLFSIIRNCFGQRRKTILNSLGGAIQKEKITNLLKGLGIDPKLRAENLSLSDYIRISNAAGKIS